MELHAFITVALGRDERLVSHSGILTPEDTAPLFIEWELSVFQSGSGVLEKGLQQYCFHY
jgi:hypothetical protein